MNNEFFNAIDVIEKTKGISKDYMFEKVKAALQSACKREKNNPEAVFRVAIDEEKKTVRAFRQFTVVEEVANSAYECLPEFAEDPANNLKKYDETGKKRSKKANVGDVFEEEIDLKNLRRLSAQNAKQVIIQGIREAERNNSIKEYEKKAREVITVIVDDINPETGDIYVDTGTGRSRIQREDLIPGDDFEPGQRIKVCITELRTGSTSGPIVTLSRSHPDFVRRLFELNVPEIADGTVEIKSIAREPGQRTKVAVWSNDENVEAVGSCIGTRSTRINTILSELSGEKIDLIEWSDNIEEYVAAALSPAHVIEVRILEKAPEGTREGWKYTTRAIVDEDQLSLAIGAQGQNARLAAKLTGCKIDIKSEED